LEIIGVDPGVSIQTLAQSAARLARQNHRLLPAGDDLGLSIFVTPGAYVPLAPAGTHVPLVAMHTYPLPFHLWEAKYASGETLVVTPIEQVAPRCWPPELKCRSRMHYYLADRAAHAIVPGARALLLDESGLVCETSTANVAVYRRDEGIVSPRRERILPGISMAVLMELAHGLGIPTGERDLVPADIACAEEVLLTSTSHCVLPVTRLGDRKIGPGTPGDTFRALVDAWSESVDVDIVAQARDMAKNRRFSLDSA
jgi:branched-subunit amino acid aminotransferase/4-amino-4-deoxychorismate lyase